MKLPSSILCSLVVLLHLPACAAYPLPQDYTGFDTHAIVVNVRCEARDGLRDAVIDTFKRYDEKVVFIAPTNERMTGFQAAAYFEADRSRFEAFNIDRVVIGDARAPFRYYATSQIAYDFSLGGKEGNTQGFDLGLTRQFGLRRDSLGFSGSAERERSVTRGFLTWDNVGTLLRAPDKYCQDGKNINIVYPITGKLPVRDLVMSYIYENDLGTLTYAKPNSLRAIEKLPTTPQMADSISFRTLLKANLSPAFAYNPVGGGLQVGTLGLTNANLREDTHRLVIAVSTAEVNVPSRFRPPGRYPTRTIDPNAYATAVNAVETQFLRRDRNAIVSISESLSRLSE